MLVLVTASRKLKPEDRPVIADGLREVVGDDAGPHTLFHGAAPGGDRLTAGIASSWGWTVRPFPADWYGPCRETCRPGHRRTRPGETRSYCPAAGNYRNQDMVDEAAALGADRRVGGLAVYKRGAKNSGTSDCRGRAAAAGIDMKRRTA